MGAYLAHPITKTKPEEGRGNRLEYGASSMQGWRISQEDAHNCLVDFDVDSSFFAVYDGHGGSEVATYLSHHLPELLKNTESYKKGNWKEALREVYLQIDESIKTPDVLKEIVRLSKFGKKTEENDNLVYENVNELYEEATMPIEMLVAKYQEGEAKYISNKLIASKLHGRLMEKPVSSKALQLEVSSGDTEVGSSSSPSKSKESGITEEAVAVDMDKQETEAQVISEPNKEELMELSTNSGDSCSDNNGIKNGDNEIPDEMREKSKSESKTLNNSDTDKSVKMNGQVEHGNLNETISEETSVSSNGLLENGSEDDITVMDRKEDKSEEVSPIIREESIIVVQKKKKGKVHQPPVLQLPKPESSPEKRTSPRKNVEKVYIDFLKGESTSEDSEDEDDPTTLGVVRSDSEESDESEDLNSSSTDENEEEGDEDADVEEEDDNSEDDEMLKDYQEPGYDSGATAVAAFVKWEGNKLHLWVANAGDSRCVVSRDGVALEMSEDHKPEDEREARRIVTAGGKVTNEGRVNGGLNLSRAIGDHSYKTNPTLRLEEQMITSLPDVEYAELNPDTDKFIILACDGIWNSMTSQQVIDFVSERMFDSVKKLSTICEELFNTCLSPDTAGDGTGCDNMTAIIVRIIGKDEPITPVSVECQALQEVERGGVGVGSLVVDRSDEPEQPKKSSGLKRTLILSPSTSPPTGSDEVKRMKIDSENP